MSDKLPRLPDGSSFFVADVMSKEEAMKLPIKDRPICFRISSEMYHAVFEAVGEASMQWKPHPSRETFDSEGASRVAINLCFKIAEEIEQITSDDWWYCDWCEKRLPITQKGFVGTNSICFCSKECSDEKDANR